MAKEEQQSNQLNLTVVALVALVAIVGLVALVMNAASVKQLATGGQLALGSQLASAEQNTAGDVSSGCYAMRGGVSYYMNSGDRAGAYKIMQNMVHDGCTNW